ncbi:MAG: hypothetical protein ACK5NF_03620 [Bacilli bacterium]
MKIRLDLFNYPKQSYIIYQIILFGLGFTVITIINVFTIMNYFVFIVGYFRGWLVISIGFYIIVYSSDKILFVSKNEAHAKSISLLFFIIRYFIYSFICVLSIRLFNANIITMFLGLLSLKIIIFVDNFLQKNGGEI